jgi:hypothetical protein
VADDNTETPPRVAGPIDDLLVPFRGVRVEQSTGRIRSLPEARAALQLPHLATPEFLRAWGKPTDFRLVAFLVLEPEQPELVAEFAALRVLRRHGHELVPADRERPLSRKEKSNGLWIVYGSVVTNTAGTHVIESLSVGPVFAGQLSSVDDDLAHGVTSPLLRLLSPSRLLSETVERLRLDHASLTELENKRGAPSMPPEQREAFAKLERGSLAQTTVSDQQSRAIAVRYLTLVQLGNTRPLIQLADEYRITRAQARDRVRKAREDRYLAPGSPGRATATPGPRLKNWTPLSTTLTSQMAAEWRDYGTRVLLTMPPEIEAIYAPMACPNPRPPIANPVIYLDNRPESETGVPIQTRD